MKRIVIKSVLSTILLLGAYAASAQRDKEFQIRLGTGAAAYSTESNLKFSIATPWGVYNDEHKDTGGAATIHLPIELRYEIRERWNIGLDMKFGSYLYEDTQENANKSNAFRSLGIGAEFVALNKNNTRIYLGLCLNSTLLEMMEKIKVGQEMMTSTMTWRGGGAKINVGIMQYFGNSPIGINFNLGADSHAFQLKDWKYPTANSLLYLNSSSGTLNVQGIDVALGLVFRIRK